MKEICEECSLLSWDEKFVQSVSLCATYEFVFESCQTVMEYARIISSHSVLNVVCIKKQLCAHAVSLYLLAFTHPAPPPHRGSHRWHWNLGWAPPVAHIGRKTPPLLVPWWARPPLQRQSGICPGNPPPTPRCWSGWHKQHFVSPQRRPWSRGVGSVVRKGIHSSRRLRVVFNVSAVPLATVTPLCLCPRPPKVVKP